MRAMNERPTRVGTTRRELFFSEFAQLREARDPTVPAYGLMIYPLKPVQAFF